jgi:hypothetical protein
MALPTRHTQLSYDMVYEAPLDRIVWPIFQENVFDQKRNYLNTYRYLFTKSLALWRVALQTESALGSPNLDCRVMLAQHGGNPRHSWNFACYHLVIDSN